MDEIKDTAADREALGRLLSRFPQTQGIDTATASVGLLNELWRRMAAELASMPDADFDAIEKWVTDQRAAIEAVSPELVAGRAWPEREPALAALRRAEELLALVVDWRHGTWEAAETAAGRNPHQVA
jgi:hypothetical protein